VSERSRLRLFVLRVLVLSILLTLFGRLWFLQVHASEDYDLAASANRVREVVAPAPRGEVLDVTGTPLVRNRTALVVSVNRALLLREPDDGKAVLDRLSALLGKPADVLAQEIRPCGGAVTPPCWRGSPYQSVPVQEYAATDTAGVQRVLAIEEHREDFPGVTAQFAAVRDYPQGTLAAHSLGYLGPISEPEVGTAGYEGVRPDALVGRAGVEASYDDALRGTDGVEQLLVDNVGRVTGKAGETAARSGDTLVLSLHAGVQQAAEQALQRAVDKARQTRSRDGSGMLRADSGSIVVMEARTGRIAAMASYPSYDPAVFVGGATPEQFADLVDEGKGAPLVFRAIQGGYAPASAFKPISTAAAVQSGDYPLRGLYPCPGGYAPLGGKRNFEGAALGTIDLRTALVKSCDTIFYKFAYEQWLRDGGNKPGPEPRDPMVAMAQAFGLGRPTGVDLPSERSGTVADRAFLRQRWEDTKANRCEGAVNPALTEDRRQINREFCEDGYRFRGGDAANFAIGQGDTLVTPLQLATVYAAVANGGQLVTPHVGRALLSAYGGGVTEIAPPARGSVPVDPQTLDYIKQALAGVTQPGGTASGAFAGLAVPVAGKTGTGEVAGKQDTSWFASFAPAAAPELVVVGMVSQGGTGGTIAAPMVREVYDAIYGLGGSPELLPGGKLPAALPAMRPDGSIAPPGEVGSQ
jgi:penicillin-binding protein 2